MLHLLMLFMLADPFVGTWKLRPDDKAAQRYDSFTIVVTASGAGHKWSYDFALKGNPKHMKMVIVTDRKAGTYKMMTEDGKPLGEGKLIIKSPLEWELEGPNHKSHGSVSADGKTLTSVTTAPMPATHVFEKQ
jgi:hypothetical protein